MDTHNNIKHPAPASLAVATGSPTIIVDPSVLPPARYMFFGAPALSARYEHLYQLQLDAWKRGDEGEVNRLGKNIDWLVNEYAKDREGTEELMGVFKRMEDHVKECSDRFGIPIEVVRKAVSVDYIGDELTLKFKEANIRHEPRPTELP